MKKNVSQDNQLQEFISQMIELKNQSDYNKIENIMKKKVVSQDNQLQAFITQIIERKNQMNFIKLKRL